jgi:leucyl/phenylalanyl-tRNA--protein transferase
MPVFVLSERILFPPAHLADESGLLAVGGDLSRERLLCAYRNGIFPWYSGGEPILWWSPDPRLVLYPSELKVSRRLQRVMRGHAFTVTFDRAFHEVIHGCAAPRSNGQPGTWLVPEMIEAYKSLHAAGIAHSVEAWHEGRLAGGLYGVSLGGCFFGESMFTRVTNASKVALVSLVRFLMGHGADLIDCQIETAHLLSFGARQVPRKRFLKELSTSLRKRTLAGPWSGS